MGLFASLLRAQGRGSSKPVWNVWGAVLWEGHRSEISFCYADLGLTDRKRARTLSVESTVDSF
jgi:hypothetical protein